MSNTAPSPSCAPIQLAFVGAGGMAEFMHLPAVQAYRNQHANVVALAAVVDPDRSRRQHFADTYGFTRQYANVSEMLQEFRPTAALTLTPYWLNAVVSEELLRAGVSVLMEKPPGMNRAETLRLIEHAERGRCVAQVGYCRRHWKSLRLALDWLKEDGEPLQFLRGSKHRTGRVKEDYVFYTSSHVVDTLLSLGGDAVECVTTRVPIPGVPDAWNFASTIRFANGCIAHATALPNVSFNQEVYELHTSSSTIVIDHHWGTDQDAQVMQYRGTELVRRVALPKGQDRLSVDGFMSQIETFFSAVMGQSQAHPTVADCLRTVELCEAIREGVTWRSSGA